METVHALPDPPVIVPRLVGVLVNTVIPMTNDGDPVVVSVVPEQEAVNVRVGVVDQLVIPQLPEVGRIQYTVFAASNVIPLFPLQSPKRVPLIGAAAPAMVMSRKSTSDVAAKVPTVRVRVVPSTSDCMNIRMVAFVPADTVSVPVIV